MSQQHDIMLAKPACVACSKAQYEYNEKSTTLYHTMDDIPQWQRLITSAAQSTLEDPEKAFAKCLCPMCQGKVVLAAHSGLTQTSQTPNGTQARAALTCSQWVELCVFSQGHQMTRVVTRAQVLSVTKCLHVTCHWERPPPSNPQPLFCFNVGCRASLWSMLMFNTSD